jgi:predicted dienelactone hydrolase
VKHRRVLVGVVMTGVLAAAGCAAGMPVPPDAAVPEVSAIPAEPVPTLTVTAQPLSQYPEPAALVPTTAPEQTFTVGRRELALSRDDRPLRTVVWYPSVPGDPGTVADGLFPLVVFSHGLRSAPESYERIIAAIAAAGFVVAAPAYPHTHAAADSYNPADLVNQPADASAVVTAVLRLGATTGDPLDGHLDATRIGAAGHSGGGFTTMGLLAGARDSRVRSAVVIAGGTLGGAFANPAAPVLFVHGDADQVVPFALGRATFDLVPWPKAFLTVLGGDHSGFLYRSGMASTTVALAIVDFLRATLYGDPAAAARLPVESAVASITSFESTLPLPAAGPSASPAESPSASASPTQP